MLAAPASAQEPSRLERIAGSCSELGGDVLGDYAGRVLWTDDGQLSGMVRREQEQTEAPPTDGRLPPSTLNIPRQRPESADEGWSLHTTAMILDRDASEIVQTAVVCAMAPAPPERGDPGATSRG